MQLLPELSQDEYEALKADIARRGVQVPVEYDEEGNILDGHHRVQACQELGIKDWPSIVRSGMTVEAANAREGMKTPLNPPVNGGIYPLPDIGEG